MVKVYTLKVDHGSTESECGVFSTFKKAREESRKLGNKVLGDEFETVLITEFTLDDPLAGSPVWTSEVYRDFGGLCCLDEWVRR